MKTLLKNPISAVLPTAALLFGASAAFAAPTTWVHPGAVNSQADLAFVASKIATNTQPSAGRLLPCKTLPPRIHAPQPQ